MRGGCDVITVKIPESNLTGVLIEQAPRLIDHYASTNVTLTLHEERDGWALLRGVNQP